MKGIPKTLLVIDQPEYLRMETDTARPQPLIPIYYIHGDLPAPFCTNPFCFCQRSKQDAARLLGDIADEHHHRNRRTQANRNICCACRRHTRILSTVRPHLAANRTARRKSMRSLPYVGILSRVYTRCARKRTGVHLSGAWQQRAGVG